MTRLQQKVPRATLAGPCRLCGDVDYPLSLGGPFVCPACDVGDAWFQSHPRAFKRMLGLAPPPATNERAESDELFLAFVVGE